MFFWNSNTTDSALLAAIEQLANNLGNINIDMPRFSNTNLSNVSLIAETITQIVTPEQKSRRTTLQIASNSSASKVILLHGISNPSLDQILDSPWSLKPGEQGFDELDGGYPIYAYAIGGEANVKIALEYQDFQPTNQSVNMTITPLFGTGANWDPTDWHYGYDLELNNSITGYKLFSFSSFAFEQKYTLTINPGDLSYQAIPHPINVYLFTLNSISKALFWRCVNGQIGLQEIRETIMPILKKGSWAARLSAAGGTFSLKPAQNRYIGLIDCKLTNQTYAKTAIFNYQQQGDDTGIFTLVGP